MGRRSWRGLLGIAVIATMVGTVACVGGEPPPPTVFVPSPTPTELPTATPPAATPTLGADVLQDYMAYCDAQLRAVLLTLAGPWEIDQVWDYAMSQVDGCEAQYWLPKLESTEDLPVLRKVFGVPLSAWLQEHAGRDVDGSVRVSFMEGYTGGDGYRHWYYFSDLDAWYSGDYVIEQEEAAPKLDRLTAEDRKVFSAQCWGLMESLLLQAVKDGAVELLRDAELTVQAIRDDYWQCAADVWRVFAFDTGVMSEYCGYTLPASLQDGPGVAYDGSFRLDFRGDDGVSHLVYVSELAAGVEVGSSPVSGYVDCSS